MQNARWRTVISHSAFFTLQIIRILNRSVLRILGPAGVASEGIRADPFTAEDARGKGMQGNTLNFNSLLFHGKHLRCQFSQKQTNYFRISLISAKTIHIAGYSP